MVKSSASDKRILELMYGASGGCMSRVLELMAVYIPVNNTQDILVFLFIFLSAFCEVYAHVTKQGALDVFRGVTNCGD